MKKTKKQEYAGFIIRLVAWVIDLVILTVVTSFLRRILFFPPFGQYFWNSFGFLISPLYSILLWVNWNGQTIGKRLLGIKVVTESGKKLEYQTAILRYVGYLISSVIFLLGYFWIIWDGKKQGWHDKIAKTLVVKE